MCRGPDALLTRPDDVGDRSGRQPTHDDVAGLTDDGDHAAEHDPQFALDIDAVGVHELREQIGLRAIQHSVRGHRGLPRTRVRPFWVTVPRAGPTAMHKVTAARRGLHTAGCRWRAAEVIGPELLAGCVSLRRVCSTGRDAADTAFLSLYGGGVQLDEITLVAVVNSDLPEDDLSVPVSPAERPADRSAQRPG